MLAEREDRVDLLLKDHMPVLEKVAAALLEKEVLDEKEFAELVGPLPTAA
jgi:ATP-dependent Zn protease